MTTQSKDAKKSVRIFINDVEFEAPDQKMTGAEIKALGGVPPANSLYEEVPGPRPDVKVEDNEVVHLKKGDRFYDIPPAVKGEDLQGVLPLVNDQIRRVRRDYPGLAVTKQADGSIDLEIASFQLPPGWTETETAVMVSVPVGYPDSKPQGFFVDTDLGLASRSQAGGLSGPQDRNGRSWNYFCWNSESWNPHRDGLWKYFKIMLSRFEDLT